MSKYYGIVYKATNKINGKSYIGQTTQSLDRRKRSHISRALNNMDGAYFHRALNKYGKINFKWCVIKNCYSLDDLNKFEIKFIREYDTFNNGYNLDLGGKGSIGFRHSEETKRKMSLSKRGKRNPNYGRVFSEEHRVKLSIAGKNRIQLKGKESLNYGRKLSDDHRKRISISNKGRVCSEETKNKISETRIKNKSTAKKYIITTPERKEIFVYGLRNFCRNYEKEKLNHANLIKVAQGKYKSYKGYRCRYLEDKDEI